MVRLKERIEHLSSICELYAKHRPNQWTKYISFAEIAYNNAIHSSTGVSPFYLVYQRHMNIPFDLTIGDIHTRMLQLNH